MFMHRVQVSVRIWCAGSGDDRLQRTPPRSPRTESSLEHTPRMLLRPYASRPLRPLAFLTNAFMLRSAPIYSYEYSSCSFTCGAGTPRLLRRVLGSHAEDDEAGTAMANPTARTLELDSIRCALPLLSAVRFMSGTRTVHEWLYTMMTMLHQRSGQLKTPLHSDDYQVFIQVH